MKLQRLAYLLIPLVCFALGLGQDSRPVRSSENGEAPISVFLLRHAEKAVSDSRDPALSEEGEARARSLAALLRAAGVTHLFSSEYVRTRSTLAPIAKTSELEVQVVGARSQDQLLKQLLALEPGSVAVVSGHSNTVPAIASALGCELPNLSETARGAMLGEHEYDRLFLLTLPPKSATSVAPKVVELRY